jgi:hypothetical protein
VTEAAPGTAGRPSTNSERFAFAGLRECIDTLDLRHSRFDIGGSLLSVLSDDPMVDQHFRRRLAPFLRSGATPFQTHWRGVVLTSTEHSRDCGLLEAELCQRPDVEIITEIPDKGCRAAVSLRERVAVVGAGWPDPDRYWMVDYLTEMIAGLMLGWDTVALHGSAVAAPWGGMAFLGDSGSGKTTLALSLAERPKWTFLADDTILLRAGGDGQLWVQPLYIDLHFAPDTVALVPGLAGRVPTEFTGRDVSGHFLTEDPGKQGEFGTTAGELWPGWQPDPTPLRAVFFPMPAAGGAGCRVDRPSDDEAWQLLSSHTLPFLCDHWPAVVERDRRLLDALLHQCWCWRLAAGSDLAGLGGVLAQALRHG